MRVVATEDNLDECFEGILIRVADIAGAYDVPGWRCLACHWEIGSIDLPPDHDCPGDGERQAAARAP